MLHLSIPAWGPTTHPSACASSASLFKQTALGFSLTWAPSRASHPASIPALPGRAPGSHPAPLGRQCSSQQPQASLSPCKGHVLWVTVRSCKELIRGEGSCSCVTDGISETAAGHPNQKELEVKCKGSLEPFWMVAGLAAGELGLLGGCQVSSLQGAGGASPALPRAVQSSAALQTLRFQPCCPQCSLCITHWGLWLHRAGLWCLKHGSLATAQGDFEKLDHASFWWERTVCTPWPSAAFSSCGVGRRQDLLSSLKSDFHLPALENYR